MSEQEETVGGDPMAKISAKVDELLQSHKHATKEEIAALKREIAEKYDETTRVDKAEREQLRAELAAVNEYVAQQKKAAEERDKVKSSSGTMVIPPGDVAPQQQPDKPTEQVPESKRPLWKRLI